MPFIINQRCPDCMKAIKTGDMWHNRYNWNKYHNGERDGDFLTWEEYYNSGLADRDKEFWKDFQKFIAEKVEEIMKERKMISYFK